MSQGLVMSSEETFHRWTYDNICCCHCKITVFCKYRFIYPWGTASWCCNSIPSLPTSLPQCLAFSASLPITSLKGGCLAGWGLGAGGVGHQFIVSPMHLRLPNSCAAPWHQWPSTQPDVFHNTRVSEERRSHGIATAVVTDTSCYRHKLVDCLHAGWEKAVWRHHDVRGRHVDASPTKHSHHSSSRPVQAAMAQAYTNILFHSFLYIPHIL